MNDIEGLGEQVLELRDEVAHLRAVIAEATKHARATRRGSPFGTADEDPFLAGADLQAFETLTILAKATQTDKGATK